MSISQDIIKRFPEFKNLDTDDITICYLENITQLLEKIDTQYFCYLEDLNKKIDKIQEKIK